MIKVSIIVPCYNVENYIGRCLYSLVNQTLQEIEIILINDASTDNTIDILKEYSNMYKDKIHIIDLKESTKKGHARNVGLNMARGKYISFVDAEDWIDLIMCEKLYNFALKGNYEVVRFQSVQARDIRNIHKIGDNTNGLIINEYNSNLYIVSNMDDDVTIHTYFLNREFLLDIGIMFPENLDFEDVYFTYILKYYIKSQNFLDEVYYYYFKNYDFDISRRNSANYFDRIEVMKLLLNDLKIRRFYAHNYNDIESYFVINYFEFIKDLFNRFDEIPFEKISEMSKFILANFDNYKAMDCSDRKDGESLGFKIKILCLCDKDPRYVYKIMLENPTVQKIMRI